MNEPENKAPAFRLNVYGYLFRRMWAFAGERRWLTVLFYGLQLVATAIILASPYILGQVINTLQAGGPDVLEKTSMWLAGLFLATAGFWLFHGPARHIERLVAFHVFESYMNDLYRKLTELPLSWHQDHHSGDTINRTRTAGDALLNFSQDQYIFVQMLLRLIFASIMLVWISPIVGGISLLALLLIGALVIAIDKRLNRILHETNEIGHTLNATFFDYVSNMTTLLMLRLMTLSQRSYGRIIRRLHDPFMQEVYLNEVKWAAMDFFFSLVSAATLILFVTLSLQGGNMLEIGTVAMIYQYQNNLAGVLRGVAGNFGALMRWYTNLSAVEPIESDHARLAQPHRDVADAAAHGMVSITGLHLMRSRAGHEEAIFTVDVQQLNLRHGEKVALIGASGGGKSTFLCLLRGIYSADRGTLQIDGRTRDLADLHDMTTLIPQDPEIFENTIRFNITLGVDADDLSIERAVQRAGFAAVLKQLPKGLETDIREKGVNLSVGQKQRLALARGFFAAEKSAIILMDEPTSSVDLQTEEQIFNTLFNDFRDKTLVASLHRLHLLPKFDRILYLENGTIVADGAPSQLLVQAGPVRTLYDLYQAKPEEFSA